MVHMLSPGLTITIEVVCDGDTGLVIGGGKAGSPPSAARAGSAGPVATARGTAARSTGSNMRCAVRTIAPLPTSEPSQTTAIPQIWVERPAIANSRRMAAAASSGGTDASHPPRLDHSGRSQAGSKEESANKQNSRAETRMTIAATYAPGSRLGTTLQEVGLSPVRCRSQPKEHT